MGKRWVLITGASTGIGEDAARALSAAGFSIFAGVRKQADAERARQAGHTPVILDVTKDEHIEAAMASIEQTLGPDDALFGLVNNAGVAVGGPFEFLPLDDVRWVFDVNVFGLLAITQAALPLLRKSTGRVVNMGSIAGRVTAPMLGPYAASKHAVEAISDGLRRELAAWGIAVALIEPGVIKTPIWEKGEQFAATLDDKLPEQARALYRDKMQAQEAIVRRQAAKGAPVSIVSDAVVHALTARRPKTRYLVGKDAKMAARALAFVTDRFADKLILKSAGWRS